MVTSDGWSDECYKWPNRRRLIHSITYVVRRDFVVEKRQCVLEVNVNVKNAFAVVFLTQSFVWLSMTQRKLRIASDFTCPTSMSSGFFLFRMHGFWTDLIDEWCTGYRDFVLTRTRKFSTPLKALEKTWKNLNLHARRRTKIALAAVIIISKSAGTISLKRNNMLTVECWEAVQVQVHCTVRGVAVTHSVRPLVPRVNTAAFCIQQVHLARDNAQLE